jgi:uncharacterized membrane protein
MSREHFPNCSVILALFKINTMKYIKQLKKISRFLQRLAYFFLLVVAVEPIIAFTDFSSPGTLFLDEYGINGFGSYIIIMLIVFFLLSAQSKKVDDIAIKINDSLK